MAIQCRRRKEKSGPSVSAQNRRHNPLRLSYASINWIRFKGSSCRAPRRMTSQSPAGTPLVAGKLTPMIRAVKMLTFEFVARPLRGAGRGTVTVQLHCR